MQPLSSNQLAEKAGVSTGLAKTLLKLPGAPDPARFNTEATYLRRLARVALAAGHIQASLQALAMKPQPRVPVEDPASEDEPVRIPARARNPDSASEVDSDDLHESAAVLRGVVAALGRLITDQLRENTPQSIGAVLGVLDKFKGLQAEFRQTAQKLDEMRAAQLLVLPRADVYAAAGRLFQAFRGFADSLSSDLLDNGALPAWVQGAGGVFPDSRQAVEFVRAEVKAFAARRYNGMADALAAMACPIEDAAPALRADCCLEMATELERVARGLREKAVASAGSV